MHLKQQQEVYNNALTTRNPLGDIEQISMTKTKFVRDYPQRRSVNNEIIQNYY